MVIWSPNQDVIFSVKSLYNKLMKWEVDDNLEVERKGVFRRIQKTDIPSKLIFFWMEGDAK